MKRLSFICAALLAFSSANAQQISTTGVVGAAPIFTNHQTGTTYTILNTDNGKLITTSNVSGSAVTLPQAGTTGFPNGWSTCIVNIGSGSTVVTPTTSTFNAVSSQTLTTGMAMCPVSDGTNYAGGVGGGAGSTPTYTGVGDVVAGAYFGGGIRAWSTAARGTVAVNLCDASDAHCADFSTDAVTGALVLSSPSTPACTGGACTVKIIYNQSGGGGGNATQATIAARATLAVGCANLPGGKPCLSFPGGSGAGYQLAGATNTGVAAPYSLMAVATRTGSLTTAQYIVETDDGSSLTNSATIDYSNSTNTVGVSNNQTTAVNATASDNAWHALMGVGVSPGKIIVDGSVTTGTFTANPANHQIGIGQAYSAITGNNLAGGGLEFGVWFSDISSSATSISTNQHAFFGF